MTSASVVHWSRPAQIRTGPSPSVRSAPVLRTAGLAREGGSRLSASSPASLLSWKMRCTVLVEVEQVSHDAITGRRVLLDHRLDGFGESRIDRRCRLGRPVIQRPTRYAEPLAQLAHRDAMASALSPWRIVSITCRPRPAGTAIFFARAAPASPRHEPPRVPHIRKPMAQNSRRLRFWILTWWP
jgi:hypothetical protein